MLSVNYLRGVFVALVALLALPVSAAELNLRIVDIVNAGTIHVFVFTSADGFPKEGRAVVHADFPKPDGSQLDLVIQVPESSEYAVMAYQDKNGDGEMNRLFGMIPQEPYALSRNPNVFGKPKFSDAAISGENKDIILMKLHD
jgi:uncharacterized protein (DUF2141 family)